MAKRPFEVIPLLVAGTVGAFVLYALVGLFDSTNTKQATYTLYGFVTGVLVQLGVRLTGVS